MSLYLSRIAIQDFRTFGAFDVGVPASPGLILLTGTNGLGKSSFFDAIEWGLTGSIRRFTPYLKKGRKKLTERDYLTRRGAVAGSHKVALTFSDGEVIERAADAATPMDAIIAKLARPDRREIHDLSTYLALTHFLGQAAQQRFTSREPQDQWQALRGPSGIERLEQVRAGLRGRPTVSAFSKRIEQEEGRVALLERQIADWQGLIARLDRLQQAARATGVLTASEVEERVDVLEAELDRYAGTTAVLGEGTSLRLTSLGDRITDALTQATARLASLEGLDDLPGLFTKASVDARQDHPVLTRLQQAVGEARAELARINPSVDVAERSVAEQVAAIAAIEQAIELLDGDRGDIQRQAQVAEQVQAAQSDLDSVGATIRSHRSSIADADELIGRHAQAAGDVARARSTAQTARAALDSQAPLADLQAAVGRTGAALDLAREAALSAQKELFPLEGDRAALEERINAASQARAEALRHATAISGALTQLASHIHESDTDCPVCRTIFEPGVLKALAEEAAVSSDSRLAMLDEELESLRASAADLDARIAALYAIVDAPKPLGVDAEAAKQDLAESRAALARVLGVSINDDLSAIARERNDAALVALSEAQASLDPLTAAAAAASEQRAALLAELDELTVREGHISSKLEALNSDFRGCTDRIAARGLAGLSFDAVETRLSDQRVQLEAGRTQIAKLREQAAAAVTAVEGQRATLTSAERELAAAESTRAAAEARMTDLAARWQAAALDDTPAEAGLDRSKATTSELIVALRALAGRQQLLATDNEAALLQGEIAQVRSAMKQAGSDAGVSDPATYLASLQGRATAARAALRLTNDTRQAVRRYSEALKTQADDFSNRVLDPLNAVIDDFNEAMLSTPGESIQFRADTRVDATSFGMALRYRDQVENAIQAEKDLPPQVVLSEGQLAANGFSILCAASTAYPWSNWRALLLDDPLQHNDIIHTAAFVDVMRNMVALNGYQLIMSSHDRGESDFIARKFDAAGLPCTTIFLTAPSEKGVVWEAPALNQAAQRVLRQSVDESQSNSA